MTTTAATTMTTIAATPRATDAPARCPFCGCDRQLEPPRRPGDPWFCGTCGRTFDPAKWPTVGDQTFGQLLGNFLYPKHAFIRVWARNGFGASFVKPCRIANKIETFNVVGRDRETSIKCGAGLFQG